MTMRTNFRDIIGDPLPTIEIVDVGAMIEGRERYAPLMAQGLATVTGFEPNPDQFALLKNRGRGYRYLPVALGNGGPATLHVTRYPGCSSLLLPNPAVIDLFQMMGTVENNFEVIRTEDVQTVRLDDIADIRADYIKLDVQGFELEILRHGAARLASTVVIETEVEFLPLYTGQPLFGDIQVFLRDQGFVLHKLIDCAGRPFRPFQPPRPRQPLSQLLWADAVFVRDFSSLESYSDDGLISAAAILDIVYESIDLAALLLAEYDRRLGSARWQPYVESLRGRDIRPWLLNIIEP